MTQYMQEAGAMKQLTDAEIDTIAREHFCRNMGDKEGDWGPNSLNQHWCEAIGRPFARAVAAALAAALPPAAVQAGLGTALDLTLTNREVCDLAAFATLDQADDDEAVRLLIGDGHSGYGLYAACPDYQEEGAVLVKSLPDPLAANEGTLTAGKQGGDGVPVGEPLSDEALRQRFPLYGRKDSAGRRVDLVLLDDAVRVASELLAARGVAIPQKDQP